MKKKASAIYEIILKTLVFMTLIATAISFFGVFTMYLNLNYAARRVVREIEISGKVSTDTYDLFDDLKTHTNIGGATMSVTASYFDVADKKIQLRDTFTVVCRSNYRINVFTPIGGTPVGFDIPLKISLAGMSERFWKDFS